MKRKLQIVEADAAEKTGQLALPEQVQVSLAEIAAQAKEGLLALSVATGLAVMGELMEHEVDEIVGPRGRHLPERSACRHGRTGGEVTLGGRIVPVERPRVRSADGSAEIGLDSYAAFAGRDLLAGVVLERMLAGVSARRYRRTQEPVGKEVEQRARSTSKSAVSRAFVERTRGALAELMSRSLDGLELAAVMIDGIELDGRCHVVALGITSAGDKVPLGLWEGSTENATVATALLSDLQERGLHLGEQLLFVLDGAKALRKAVRRIAGERAPVQRCVRHKERNVMEHLPERERAAVRMRLRRAWANESHPRALRSLRSLAAELERAHPSAAASLREGMEETVTVNRLGVSGALKATLSSTNPVESMIELVRASQRNVKRWQPGDMRLRWTAAGMLEAQKHFRRIKGHRDLDKLAAAIRRELHPTEEEAILAA